MAQVQLDEELLKDLGFDKFPEEEKRAILTTMVQNLEMSMGLRVAEILSDEQLLEFNKLIGEGKDSEAQQFLRDNVANYEEIAREELQKYKDVVKGITSEVTTKDSE